MSYRGDYRVRLGAILAAGLWLALGAHASEAGEAQALPEDPAIRRGVLANGLRYAIRSNAIPQGGLSLRLAFDIGSLVETDEERGAAHFVEHMAFRDTRSFPEGELEPVFAPLGVQFGRDQNAFTGLDSTLYLVDLPTSGAKERALAFRWLRDVADGVRFEPAAVDRERGVVLAERNARRSPDTLVADAITEFQTPELRGPKRSPIGTLATVEALSGADLETFYRRWYRPERAVVVVVGEIADMPALEAQIAQAFADWRPATSPPKPPPLSMPNLQRGPDAISLAESSSAPSLSICRIGPRAPKGRRDLAALRRDIVRTVWLEALRGRLLRLALDEPTIIGAEPGIFEDDPEATRICVSASLAGEDWRRQLATLQDEIRSLSERDLTDDELDAAVQNVRGGLLGYVQIGQGTSSSDMASGIARSILADETVMEPRQTLRAFNQAVVDIDPAQLRAAWNADWAGAGPLIALVMPKPPPRAAVLSAWQSNQQGALAARGPSVAPTVQWAYGVFDAPGAVAQRETFTGPRRPGPHTRPGRECDERPSHRGGRASDGRDEAGDRRHHPADAGGGARAPVGLRPGQPKRYQLDGHLPPLLIPRARPPGAVDRGPADHGLALAGRGQARGRRLAGRSSHHRHRRSGDPEMKSRLPLFLALALACASPALASSPDFERASALLNAGKVQEAVNALETAVARDQNDIEALLALSYIYLESGMVQAALAQADAAVRVAPDNTDALLARARIHQLTGDLKKARADLDRVLAKAPNAPALHVRGFVNAAEKDIDAALADFQAAHALDPAEVAYPYAVGLAFNDLERQTEALAAFELALSIDPDSEDAGRERAAALVRLERTQDALDAYKALVKAHPDSTTIRLRLAATYSLAGDNARALAGYTEVTRRDPKSMDAWWGRAEMLDSMGRTKEALQSYDRAVSLDPANTTLLAERGFSRYFAGDTAQAFVDLNAAVKIDPKSSQALATRGYVFWSEGQLEKALADYDAAVEADPANVFALVSRAETLLDLGKFDRALRDMAVVIKADPHPDYYRFQGQIYATMGDHLSATEAFDRAIALAPQDAEALLRRSRSKLELGDRAGADMDRTQALKLNPKVEAEIAEAEA